MVWEASPARVNYLPTIRIVNEPGSGGPSVGLWIIGLVLSLNMLIQAIRNPYVPSEGDGPLRGNKGLLILGAAIVIAFVLGATLYWIPLR
jgi:hypothetical protein